MKRKLTGCDIGCLVFFGILAVLYFAFVLPLSINLRNSFKISTCISNQRQINTNIRIYTDENDGILPKIDVWQGAGTKNNSKLLSCPSAKLRGDNYGYSKNLLGVKINDIENAENLILTADAIEGLQDNILISVNDMSFRHFRKTVCISFVDGSGRSVKEEDFAAGGYGFEVRYNKETGNDNRNLK